MFLGTEDIIASEIEVFKLERKPYRRAASWRPFHAISFRIYGEASYESNGKTITARPGDLLFVPALTPYIKDTHAEQFYVVHFYGELPEGVSLQLLTPGKPEKYRLLFEKMLIEQTQKHLGYNYRIRQLFYCLLADMEQEYADNRGSAVETVMRKALRIMHGHYMEPDFSIGTLCDQLNISDTYFRRQFHQMKGMSPKKYLTSLKLETAMEFLRSGYYSVGQVANKCGFASTYYFSAFIKQATGKPPKDWLEESTEK